MNEMKMRHLCQDKLVFHKKRKMWRNKTSKWDVLLRSWIVQEQQRGADQAGWTKRNCSGMCLLFLMSKHTLDKKSFKNVLLKRAILQNHFKTGLFI